MPPATVCYGRGMNRALLVIDLQNEYFPGGAMELVGIHHVAERAAALLAAFRYQAAPVIHIRHVMRSAGAPAYRAGTSGVEIHPRVAPRDGETVVTKHHVNAFRETLLDEELRRRGTHELVICGAMSHMCIDGTTRAAVDFGYRCTVVHDACATRDLEFAGQTIAATDVHGATMAALAWGYCTVASTAEFLARYRVPSSA